MLKQRSESFTSKDKDGNQVVLHVRRPTTQDNEKARMTFNATLSKALNSGALLRAKLESFMRLQNIWDDEKQQKSAEIFAIIATGTQKLYEGGCPLKEAKAIAIRMAKARDDLVELFAERNRLDANTAEGQAQNMEFNHLVSLCTVYNDTGKPYYVDIDAFLNDESEISLKAPQYLASLIYDVEESKKDLPENKFLLKYKFIDSKFRFINKDGKLVNENGDLVDEEGRRINENDELININGEPIKEKVFQPFLDDDGNPIPE